MSRCLAISCSSARVFGEDPPVRFRCATAAPCLPVILSGSRPTSNFPWLCAPYDHFRHRVTGHKWSKLIQSDPRYPDQQDLLGLAVPVMHERLARPWRPRPEAEVAGRSGADGGGGGAAGRSGADGGGGARQGEAAPAEAGRGQGETGRGGGRRGAMSARSGEKRNAPRRARHPDGEKRGAGGESDRRSGPRA